MRGMQTGGAEGDAIPMRFNPRPAGEYVISSPLGALPPVYFLSATQRCLLNLSKQISSPFIQPRERTLPVMSAEIKQGSQICWLALSVFDLQSGSLRSTLYETSLH